MTLADKLRSKGMTKLPTLEAPTLDPVEFAPGFRRTKPGRWSRHWGPFVVTVYQHRSRWGWCYRNLETGEAHYGDKNHRTKTDAIEVARFFVGAVVSP